MRIKIAERLRPYSHLPGTFCYLPGSYYSIEIFPTLLRIWDLRQIQVSMVKEISIGIMGPVKKFTLMLDLERGHIEVSGENTNGFFRYRLSSGLNGEISLYIEKSAGEGLEINKSMFHPKESLALISKTSSQQVFKPIDQARLSLGCQKSQDWDFIKRRLDLKEILPIWYRMGQMIPQIKPLGPGSDVEGPFKLIQSCKELLKEKKHQHIAESLLSIFQVSFFGIMAPMLKDKFYQGIIHEEKSFEPNIQPLQLIVETIPLIRSLFIEQQNEHIHILPHIPPQFHCGRFNDIPINGGVISMEWTKKKIRRMIFSSQKSQQAVFVFDNEISRFRLRKKESNQEHQIKTGIPLHFEENCVYLFDNFQ